MTDLPAKAILKCLAPRPMATLRLICFPHAGAGASIYQTWPSALPESIEVFALQLPGREDLLGDAPFTDWSQMMASLIQAFQELPPCSLALFGHSLGANMALEAARMIAEHSPERLKHLFVSGRFWPGKNLERQADIPSLTDNAFLELMTQRYGDQGEAMNNQEIRSLTLPILRADVMLLSSYQWKAEASLPCPMTVMHGTHDPGTKNHDLSLWQRESTSPLSIMAFDGGHLFHIDQKQAVIAAITSQLEKG